MTTDFEHDLRDALHREAARAPRLSAAGRQLDQTVDAPPVHGSSRVVLAAAACLIVLVGVGGLIVTQRDSNPTNVIVSDTAPDSSNGPDDVIAAPTTEPTAVAPVPEVKAPTTALEPPLLPAGTVGLAIGDSRMLGAVPDLQQYGFTIDALESRQFTDGVDIVEDLAERDLLPDVVVVDLGNNGSIQQEDLDRMMAQLRDVPTVVMFTSTVERDWQAPNNTMIRALPATEPNVTVVDFEAQASECPGDCFAVDNIHLNPDGARFYASLIADAVGLEQLAPLPATPGSTSPPVLSVETTRPASAVITRLAIGDSLMVDAGSELSAAGFTVDAVAGRQFADVVEILAPLRADGRLGDVVVLSVAEDGPIDRATADQVMAELTDVNNVIILTSSGDHPWTTTNNALIYHLAATYPNVTLADWQSLDENCRGDCFDDDGVHLRPDGQQFYADVIAEFANL